MSYHIFKKLIFALQTLVEKYPVLLDFLSRSEHYLKDIIDFSYFKNKGNLSYFLPSLKKEKPSYKKIITNEIDVDKFLDKSNFTTIDLANYNLVSLLKSFTSSKNKWIIDVSNKGKVKILEKIFKSLNYNNF